MSDPISNYPYSACEAPKSFLRRVREEVDKGIEIKWNHVLERWRVFYRNPNTHEPYLIIRVENEDGSYCPLDQRVITRLQAGDTRKWPRAKEVHRKLVERNKKGKKEKEDKLEEERKYKNKQEKTRWAYVIKNAREGNFG